MYGDRCTNCGKIMCECPPGINKNLSYPVEPFHILTPEESERLHDFKVVDERPGYKKEKNGYGKVRITKKVGNGISVIEYSE